MQYVKICGINHKIIECEDTMSTDLHLGMWSYMDKEIRINKFLAPDLKNETLLHEILHGILAHIGQDALGQDEALVQSLANALNQCVTVDILEEKEV